MIKRASDLRTENIHELKGGKGTLEMQHIYEAADFYGKGRLFGITTIHPGDSVGLHRHEGDQEAYFILEGEALYQENDTEYRLNPGDLALCRDGDSHGIINVGSTDLKYVALILYTTP